MALPAPEPGSTALVTGASAGIGAEIARGLAERGHGVTLVARREERLREIADEIHSRHGVRAEVLAADLADEASRDALATGVEALGLRVEVLVNNAGFGGFSDFAEEDRATLLKMLRLNAEALLDLQARYLPGMVERGRGAVINIASGAGFQPLPGNATYAATKAFVLSLGEAVHHELKGTGVALTTVCPGPVRTEFLEVAGIPDAEANTPGFLWSTAEEVAAASIRGAEHGTRVVIPGTLNRALTIVGQHSPRRVALPMASRLFKIAE